MGSLHQVIRIYPWEIIFDKRLFSKFNGLKERYPGKGLVPFAVKMDCDDFAAWDEETKKIYIMHDYSSVAWERKITLNSLNEWLRYAIEDTIEYIK